jgi:hypothetical protein
MDEIRFEFFDATPHRIRPRYSDTQLLSAAILR